MPPVKRFLIPLIFGLGGFAILLSLGLWQLNRLAEKESILAEIDARLKDDPVALPATVSVEKDRFLPVALRGDFDGHDVPVFLSHSGGPIYRLIAAFETEDGRRIMVDRGGIPASAGLSDTARTGPMNGVSVTGNLHWPDEVDTWTPEPDARGVFFGRDIAAMAKVMETEPILVVARTVSENTPQATPLPVTSAGIPNNHLGYAVQWFGLAAVWAGMTIVLLWRIRSAKPEEDT